jgi:hypothetical protein
LDGADVTAKRRKTDAFPSADHKPGAGSHATGDVLDFRADGVSGSHSRDDHLACTTATGKAAIAEDETRDASLERYEYAGVSSILSGQGAVGFAVTCAFNREKSATKEILELLRPHLLKLEADDAYRWRGTTGKINKKRSGLRLNPVKMPGRGFVFVRLSRRPSDPSDACEATAVPEAQTEDARVPSSDDDIVLGRIAGSANAAMTRSVRDGKTDAPRWIEKCVAIQKTCALRSVVGDRARASKTDSETESGIHGEGLPGVSLTETVSRVVAAALARFAGEARVPGEEDWKEDDHQEMPFPRMPITFAISFANRFKGSRGVDVGSKTYAREGVVPSVAAAAAAALEAFARESRDRARDGKNDAPEIPKPAVDLRDPDVTFFVEVLSVPAESADGSRTGEFAERLAIGAAARRDGVFERRRGGIRPVALKRIARKPHEGRTPQSLA